MEIKQQLKLSQQLVMTPQLQQAIRLLQLSRLELIDEIRKELDANPVLSDDEGERPPPQPNGDGAPPPGRERCPPLGRAPRPERADVRAIARRGAPEGEGREDRPGHRLGEV